MLNLRIMENQRLKLIRNQTDYLGCNEHQETELHLQGETITRVNTFAYLGSMLVGDGELDVEVTHRVRSGWKNGKSMSVALRDRNMNVEKTGKAHRTAVRPACCTGHIHGR